MRLYISLGICINYARQFCNYIATFNINTSRSDLLQKSGETPFLVEFVFMFLLILNLLAAFKALGTLMAVG